MTFRAAIVSLSLAAWLVPAATAAEPNSRTFTLPYAGAVTGLQPSEVARVWLPVPPSNGDQDVRVVETVTPVGGKDRKVAKEATYGNEMLYFEAKADSEGKVPFEVTYRVTRREVR